MVHFLVGSPPAPSPTFIWQIALALSLVAWLIVLVVVGLFGNYGVLRIAAQALVTAILTGTLTVWAIYSLHVGWCGMLLGWLVGFVVGKCLCLMCFRYPRSVS